MPLLRAKELAYPLAKAKIALALCDARLADEMEKAKAQSPDLKRIVYWGNGAPDSLEALMSKPGYENFAACDTASRRRLPDRLHLRHHRRAEGHHAFPPRHAGDLRQLRQARAAAPSRPTSSSARRRSPSPSGSAGWCCFRCASAPRRCCWRRPAPDELLDGDREIQRSPSASPRRPPIARCSASSTEHDISSLRKCVSAGETLPKATFEAWHEATGIKILDGIGATEMLHIFIGSPEDEVRAGSTGKPVPGYEARILDDDGNEAPPGTVGRLAVRGPTGCRYLADERQTKYVQDGWNVTGDTYLMDADGYFWYQARSDDMIISAGYNIAGPEVEAALLTHAAVAECGVVGAPDEERGQIVKAYVVLRAGHDRRRRDDQGAAGSRQGDDRALQISARHRVRRRAAEDRRPASCSASSCADAPPKAPRASSRHEENARVRPTSASSTGAAAKHQTLQPPGWPQPQGLRQRHQGARRVRVRRRHGRLGRAGAISRGLRRAGAAGAGEHRRGAGRGRRGAGARRAAHLVRARHGRVSRRAAASSARPIAR